MMNHNDLGPGDFYAVTSVEPWRTTIDASSSSIPADDTTSATALKALSSPSSSAMYNAYHLAYEHEHAPQQQSQSQHSLYQPPQPAHVIPVPVPMLSLSLSSSSNHSSPISFFEAFNSPPPSSPVVPASYNNNNHSHPHSQSSSSSAGSRPSTSSNAYYRSPLNTSDKPSSSIEHEDIYSTAHRHVDQFAVGVAGFDPRTASASMALVTPPPLTMDHSQLVQHLDLGSNSNVGGDVSMSLSSMGIDMDVGMGAGVTDLGMGVGMQMAPAGVDVDEMHMQLPMQMDPEMIEAMLKLMDPSSSAASPSAGAGVGVFSHPHESTTSAKVSKTSLNSRPRSQLAHPEFIILHTASEPGPGSSKACAPPSWSDLVFFGIRGSRRGEERDGGGDGH